MSDEIAVHDARWKFNQPLKLPDGDERPQPVHLFDAHGRLLLTMTANEFLRAHGRADEATDRPPQPLRYGFHVIRRCSACGARMGQGVCVCYARAMAKTTAGSR